MTNTTGTSMVVIRTKRTPGFIQQLVINGDASPGTWGNLQLLTDELRRLDDDWIDGPNDRWKKMKFNTDFLEEVKAKHGELHCEYCGKPDLVIYSWNEKPNRNKMATADHWLPSDSHPQLTYVKHNLLVSCDKCNNRKKAHIWSREEIKFPYPGTLEKLPR